MVDEMKAEIRAALRQQAETQLSEGHTECVNPPCASTRFDVELGLSQSEDTFVGEARCIECNEIFQVEMPIDGIEEVDKSLEEFQEALEDLQDSLDDL